MYERKPIEPNGISDTASLELLPFRIMFGLQAYNVFYDTDRGGAAENGGNSSRSGQTTGPAIMAAFLTDKKLVRVVRAANARQRRQLENDLGNS